ncbi:MAG: DISARM system phospholipase D-like protein DrmC [Candidatus Thiodiazotropha sp. (ex Dulcina madagascariensis)]|nr:DISARM system phospholipase D-like protein DrmC [Candidatus Thiodiazotropha sp. (ex Dulcina madagascariensis)]
MQPTNKNLSAQIAEVARTLGDIAGLEDVCVALENGRLQADSTGAIRSAVAGGSSAIERGIGSLQDLWRQNSTLSGSAIALALRCALSAAQEARRGSLATQVVWTGPRVEGSFLRSTREVVRELLRGAKNDIIVVGYWIAAREDGEGIIEEVIALLADAVRRRVQVTVIVDERKRADGRDNRQILLQNWPENLCAPRILTWRLPQDDSHLKLHAKVLVADNADALVTSANLTFYAMDRNMEMGVRVTGDPAASIAGHFQRLVDSGELEDYEQDQNNDRSDSA